MLRVGIIGCGMITRTRHAPEYAENPDVEICGFFDANADRAKELTARYGGKVYESAEVLISDPAIEAISVCAPNWMHASLTIKALEAGKHVLCEKPMALDLEEARAMMQASERSGKALMLGHNQRLLPAHIRAKEILTSGNIGELLSFQTNFRHSGSEGWSIDRNSSTWFFDKKQAKFGALGDLGSHKLDLIRYLTNDEVNEVFAEKMTLDKRTADGKLIELDDNACCMFRMKKGTYGQMSVSWTNYGKEDNSTVLYGTKGTMTIFGGTDDIIMILRDQSVVRYSVGGIQTNANQIKTGIIDEFVNAILESRKPLVTGTDGYNTLATLVAAEESCAAGRWVKVTY